MIRPTAGTAAPVAQPSLPGWAEITMIRPTTGRRLPRHLARPLGLLFAPWARSSRDLVGHLSVNSAGGKYRSAGPLRCQAESATGQILSLPRQEYPGQVILSNTPSKLSPDASLTFTRTR